MTAEKLKDVAEPEMTPKSENDELGVGTPAETVETKPAPVTMTQIVKIIADIHTLSKLVSYTLHRNNILDLTLHLRICVDYSSYCSPMYSSKYVPWQMQILNSLAITKG